MLTATRVTSIFHGMINHIGQPPPQTAEEQQAAIQQAMGRMIHELSLNLYQRAAADLVAGERDIDDERLHKLARASEAAAKAYFVGVGAMHKAPSPIET